MEDANSLIIHGFKLAKDLESILHSQPDPVVLSKFCDDIIKTFTAAKEMLMAGQSGSQMEPSLQEWMRANISPSAVDMWLMAAARNPEAKGDIGGGAGGSSSLLPVDASNVNTAWRASSSQRPRSSRRKEDARTVRVAAPLMGNTEIPPDDGFTWRKYGQKEILAARFPRGYYRCTHQKLYNCPAKKQVQRLDDDPSTFEITYCGEHTCHKTDTAPSVMPPPADTSSSSYQYQHQHASTVIGSSSWLEFSLGGSDHVTIRSTPATTPPGGGAGLPSSSAAYNRELPDYPITDLADTMFNSGSNSSNSMEFLFTRDIAKDD